MPSPRTAILPGLDRVRRMMREQLDFRLADVTIVTRTWSGQPGAPGGTFTDAPVLLVPAPKVVQLSAPEVSGSGGRYQTGDLRVGPITPPYRYPTPGGYSEAQLRPTPSTGGVEVLYVLTGPNAGEYSLVELNDRLNLRYELILRRRRSSP